MTAGKRTEAGHLQEGAVFDHLMLVQDCQELVAEVLSLAVPLLLQRLQVLAMPKGVQLVVLVLRCPLQGGSHVVQLAGSLHAHGQGCLRGRRSRWLSGVVPWWGVRCTQCCLERYSSMESADWYATGDTLIR